MTIPTSDAPGPAPGDDNAPLHNYTHMPTHMRGSFSVEDMRMAEMAPPFAFTKGCPVMKIPGGAWRAEYPEARRFETMLFDLENDPHQQRSIDDSRTERMMIDHLVRLMKENDAPAEQFQRLGLQP